LLKDISNKNIWNNTDSKYIPWLICLSAGLFFFYEFFQLNVFDVINQSLRASFNINATQLSFMSSTFIWANVIFLLPAGIILDYFSARKVIIVALSICIIGTFGFGLTDSFKLATFFHSLTGVGNAFCFLACVVLVSRWFAPRHQALVIGSIVTMAFLGGMAAHTPFAYLNNNFGLKSAILIDAGLGVFILIWIYFFVHDKKIGFAKSINKKSWFLNFKGALLNKQTWLAGLYTSTLNLPIMVLCALWGGSYLAKVHGLSLITASNITSLVFIGSIIGCPLFGYLSDKQGKRKPIMLIGAIAYCILTLPLIFSTNLSILSLSIIFALLGIFSSAQIISYPLIAESNTSNNTGIATGIASIIIMSGGGIAQLIFGYIMQPNINNITTQYTNHDFMHAMLIFPIAAIVAITAVLLMKETYCKPFAMQICANDNTFNES
jgi:MFS family permease